MMFGVTLTWKVFDVQKLKALDYQRRLTAQASLMVTDFIKNVEDRLTLISQITEPYLLDYGQQNDLLLELLSYEDIFDELALLDRTGREIVRVSRLEIVTPADLRSREDLREFFIPIQENIISYGRVRFDETTGEPLMAMGLRIIDYQKGDIIAVLIADLRLKKIWDLIASIPVGGAGQIYMVDEDGRVVASQNPSIVLRGAHFDLPARDGVYRGLKSAEALLAIEKINIGEHTFGIVAERPVTEAMALTWKTIMFIALAVLITSVAAGALGFVTVRRIVNPIRDLAETARAIQSGQFSKRANVFGSDEIDALATAFNDMTHKLLATLDKLSLEIDERKRAELELKEVRDRYQRIFNFVPVSIWEEDLSEAKEALNGLKARGIEDYRTYFDEHPEFVEEAVGKVKINDVNEATLSLYGARDKTDLLTSLDKIFVPESIDVFKEELVALAEGRSQWRGEALTRTIDGRIINVLLSLAMPVNEDKFDKLLVCVVDITEIKKAEDELKRSERRYRDLIERSKDGFAMVDEKGKIVAFNSTFQEMLGYTEQELKEKTYVDITLEKYHEAEQEILRTQVDKRGYSEWFQKEYIRKDGSVFPVEMRVSIYGDSPDETKGLWAFVRDITEQKKAEEELATYRGHLEELVLERTKKLESVQEELLKRERLSVLGQLTAMVSHELRNPLGVIRTSSYYMKRKLKGCDETIKKHLDRIEEQVDMCDSIVTDLLDFTKGRKAEMVREDLNELVKKTLPQVVVPKSVKFSLKLSENLSPVRFDSEKMRRVIVNLIENALQAVLLKFDSSSDENPQGPPRVELQTTQKADRVYLEVRDNGVGVDAETAARVFEPLFTTRARGTGLGLAIVRKIIEEHGGTVALESEKGEGATFTISLPVPDSSGDRSAPAVGLFSS